MNNDWLQKYPRAAAMLQGDDDVLLYEPQSCRGLEAPSPAERAALHWQALTLDLDVEEIDRGDW
jgi:hypothetical protein